jgi:putative transposase
LCKEHKEIIDFNINECRRIYNCLLHYNKTTYKLDKKSSILGRKSLYNFVKDFKYKNIYSQVIQNVAIRLQNAYNRFFAYRKYVKSGYKPELYFPKTGYPKFKKYKEFSSITYPQVDSNIKLLSKNKIKLPKIGKIKFINSFNITNKDLINCKMITIKRDCLNNYYIYFIMKEINTCVNKSTRQVGIDLGLRNFVTTNTGNTIKVPTKLKKYERLIRIRQRKLSKKQRGSRNYVKAKIKLAQLYNKVESIRKDFFFKVAKKLCKSYKNIAIEDCLFGFMQTKKVPRSIRRLAKIISISTFKSILNYMASKYDSNIIPVDSKYSSQLCNCCNTIVSKDLRERVHRCPTCKLELDRDVNAARNIYNRAFNKSLTQVSLFDIATVVATEIVKLRCP